MFNHLIVYVPAQKGISEPLWIDPSCEHCEPGVLPTWSQNKEQYPEIRSTLRAFAAYRNKVLVFKKTASTVRGPLGRGPAEPQLGAAP